MTWTPDTVPIRPVGRFLIDAVLETEPVPDYPEFDGAPLTLKRLQDKDAFGNNGQRRKAEQVWRRFSEQVQAVMRRRSDKLLRLFLVQGVALDVPPLAEWGTGLEGLDLETCAAGTLKLVYLHTLLPDPEAKLALLTRIMEASHQNPAVIDQVRALFREALAQATQSVKAA